MVLIGSSGWDEFAFSKGGDEYIGQPLTDEFSFNLYKLVKEAKNKTDKELSLVNFVKEFPKSKIKSQMFIKNLT